MHIKKEDLLKLPNILTYIRILLVPVFIYVFLNDENPLHFLFAGGVVVLSALTDLLDGLIARKFNIITDWGKFIDPIADKLMQAAMFFCIIITAVSGDKAVFFSLLIITILFVVKELVSFFVSFVLYKKRGKHLDGSIWCGKACTVTIYVVMLTLIIFPNLGNITRIILLLIAGIFLLIAFVVYMYEYKKMFSESRKETKLL